MTENVKDFWQKTNKDHNGINDIDEFGPTCKSNGLRSENRVSEKQFLEFDLSAYLNIWMLRLLKHSIYFKQQVTIKMFIKSIYLCSLL